MMHMRQVSENATDNLSITTVMPTRVSKRVMAAEDQGQPARVTRQRTREQQSTNEDLDGSRTCAEGFPIQHDDQIEICNEGKFPFF